MTRHRQSYLTKSQIGHFALFRAILLARFLLLLIAATPLVLTSCGGGGDSAARELKTVQVSIDPLAATVLMGGTKTFTATVTGSANTAVDWKVREGATGGAITKGGVYTAPRAPGTYHVAAVSQADSTKSATATVDVPSISVAITPAAATVAPGGTETFSATVTGSVNTKVTWTVQEGAAGGAITGAGLYTAPSATGIYHVVATSAADTTRSATASVTVTTSSGRFTPTGDLDDARVFHRATLLLDGKVLVTGGAELYPFPFSSQATAELFDPATGSFTLTSSMASPRYSHTATLLPNGKVLVTGGFGASGTDGEGDPILPRVLGSAELYNPSAGAFEVTSNLKTGRGLHTATLLTNGKVLIVGGTVEKSGGASTPMAELYDPTTGAFTPTGSMATPRSGHTATLLPNGKVLIAGGGTKAAELFDSAAGTFTPTGSLSVERGGHTATLLPNGMVLITGGSTSGAGLATAELYDPSKGSFTATGSMSTARYEHTATLLPNGLVLVAGGWGTTDGRLESAELYDPDTGSFTPTGSMGTPRGGHTATLLPDGRVLVAGGGNFSPGAGIGPISSAELYE